MFFLFLFSGVFGSIMIYRLSASIMSKHQIDFDIVIPETVQNMAINLFSGYNQIIAESELYCNKLYNEYEVVHNVSNYCYYIVNKLFSTYYQYKIEPPEQNWINHTILYNSIDCINHRKLAEFYDVIAHNPNQDMLKAVIYNKVSKIVKHRNNNNIRSHQNLFIMKFNNIYIYKTSSEGLYNMQHTDFTAVSNPFFSIEYKNLDTQKTIDIDLPKNICIEGNEILSIVFIMRLFAYKQMNEDMCFTMNYRIHITDENFEEVIIKPHEYILLTKDSYAIKNE